MAESFTVSGRECSVGDFDGKPNGWEDFCDCMFLEPPASVDTYWSNGVFLPDGPVSNLQAIGHSMTIVPPQIPTYAATLPVTVSQPGLGTITVTGTVGEKIAILKQHGFQLESRTYMPAEAIRTADWYKCQRKYCALPWGCENLKTGELDPFNIDAKMWAAPWTDFGSVARGIPTRSKGLFWQDIAGVLSIDFKEYETLNMWNTFWRNPGKYAYLVAKMAALLAIVPGASISWVAFNNPLALTQAVLADTLAQNSVALLTGSKMPVDPFERIFKPMIEGGGSTALFILQAFPSGFEALFAARPMQLAGVIFQKICQDQISTGEIEKIRTPEIKALILFFSKTGQEIGKKLDSFSANLNLKSVEDIFRLFEDGLMEIAKHPDMPFHEGAPSSKWPAGPPVPGSIASWALQFSVVMGVASIIAGGVADGEDAFEIVDQVIYKIFGFRFGGPDGLKAALLKGPTAIKALFAGSSKADVRAAESEAPKMLKDTLDTISKFFADVVAALTDLSNGVGSFGGAIQGFIGKFGEFGDQFAGVKALTEVEAVPVINQAAQTTSTHAALSTVTQPESMQPTGALTVGTFPMTSPLTMSTLAMPQATVQFGTKQTLSTAGRIQAMAKGVTAGTVVASAAPGLPVGEKVVAASKVSKDEFLEKAFPKTQTDPIATVKPNVNIVPTKGTTAQISPTITPAAEPVVPTQPIAAQPKKSNLALVGGAALTGAFVGGPLGAVVGGGIALALGFRTQKPVTTASAMTITVPAQSLPSREVQIAAKASDTAARAAKEEAARLKSMGMNGYGFGYFGADLSTVVVKPGTTSSNKTTAQDFLKTQSAPVSAQWVDPRVAGVRGAVPQTKFNPDAVTKVDPASLEVARKAAQAIEAKAKADAAAAKQAQIAQAQAAQAAQMAQAQQAQAAAQAQAAVVQAQVVAQAQAIERARIEAQARADAERGRLEAERARAEAEARALAQMRNEQAAAKAAQLQARAEAEAEAARQAAKAAQTKADQERAQRAEQAAKQVAEQAERLRMEQEAKAKAQEAARALAEQEFVRAKQEQAKQEAKVQSALPPPPDQSAQKQEIRPMEKVTAQQFLQSGSATTVADPLSTKQDVVSTSASAQTTGAINVNTGRIQPPAIQDIAGPAAVSAKPSVDTAYYNNPTESAPLEERNPPKVTGAEFLAMQTNTNEILGVGATVGSKVREIGSGVVDAAQALAPAPSKSGAGMWLGVAALVGGALYLNSRKRRSA